MGIEQLSLLGPEPSSHSTFSRPPANQTTSKP